MTKNPMNYFFETPKSLFLLCLILLSSIVFSCEKDEKSEPKSNLPKVIAGEISKSWKLVKMEAQGVDFLEDKPECLEDDYLIFYANKKLEYVEGENKCEDTEIISETETWSISQDGKTLKMDEQILSVIQITESKMVLKSNISFEGVTPTYTYEAL